MVLDFIRPPGESSRMADDQIYRQLQVQLDRYPIGYPATKSGVEIDILKYFFTPRDAAIALCLSLRSIGVDAIRKRLKNKFRIEFSHEEMTTLLDGMFMKGIIRRSQSASSPRYGVAMLAIGMFEYHVDDLTPELVDMMHRYFDEAFGTEFFASSLPQLRTSPHLAAILP
jgi:Na+-translocating ferredoxin:NAD+ oxidoreductase subunit B